MGHSLAFDILGSIVYKAIWDYPQGDDFKDS